MLPRYREYRVSVPDNGDGSGDGELCSVGLESEVVCGKCDARRLAASIDPHKPPPLPTSTSRTRVQTRVRVTRTPALPVSRTRRVLLSWATAPLHTLIPIVQASCTCPMPLPPPRFPLPSLRSLSPPSTRLFSPLDAGRPKGSESYDLS